MEYSSSPLGPVATAVWNGFRLFTSAYTVQSVLALPVDIPDIVSSPSGISKIYNYYYS